MSKLNTYKNLVQDVCFYHKVLTDMVTAMSDGEIVDAAVMQSVSNKFDDKLRQLNEQRNIMGYRQTNAFLEDIAFVNCDIKNGKAGGEKCNALKKIEQWIEEFERNPQGNGSIQRAIKYEIASYAKTCLIN